MTRTSPAAGTVSAALREFAEHPGLHLAWDNGGKIALHRRQRMCVVVGPTFGVVTAIDAEPGDGASILAEVRELIPAGVKTDWYFGPSTRPVDIADELLALGLREPSDGSGNLHALLLDREPSGVPLDVETHVTAAMSDFAAAAEVRMEAFGLTEEEREHERGFLVTYYDEYLRLKDRSTIAFVATLDGRVAGSASALLSDRGLFLIGGATAPWARGRGVYRALVGARWRYAVERGTPALTVHAIHDTSSPILRRVGFTEVCAMRCLEGRPS
jgi:GNAT superfamily N-acetyltransferase